MDGEIIAIKYLGKTFVTFIICGTICFLANLGFNTYIKYQDKNKMIEVHAENSNQRFNDIE